MTRCNAPSTPEVPFVVMITSSGVLTSGALRGCLRMIGRESRTPRRPMMATPMGAVQNTDAHQSLRLSCGVYAHQATTAQKARKIARTHSRGAITGGRRCIVRLDTLRASLRLINKNGRFFCSEGIPAD